MNRLAQAWFSGERCAELVEVMGGSGLEVGVLDPLDTQASLPARHLTPSSNDAVYLAHPSASRAARSRASGFVLCPTAAIEGPGAPRWRLIRLRMFWDAQ